MMRRQSGRYIWENTQGLWSEFRSMSKNGISTQKQVQALRAKKERGRAVALGIEGVVLRTLFGSALHGVRTMR